ncbi:zinc finger protein 211-like [Dermacentor silvarum]|uniref:zinc finger protein 211-like n=1 Tax=Dermacentor silvarum TaxID=543639 RepID=UPI002101916C|nr:zinc finger protein 211-like [Dermacentor silvarum]
MDYQDSVAVHRRPGRPRSLQDKHMGKRLRRCLVCGYTTVYHSSMQNHQRIHTGERPHKCDYCGKAFMQKGNLVAHLRIHTGERPFLCHLCPMAFTQKINLIYIFLISLLCRVPSYQSSRADASSCRQSSCVHREAAHRGSRRRLLRLPTCQSHFHRPAQGRQLQGSKFNVYRKNFIYLGVARWQHSAQEHVNDLSVRQVGQYFPLAENSGGDLCPPENVDIELHICSYCSKSFATRGNLNAHLRIHTGERPFQCHLCPKAFTQKATLVHHVRTHTGERPYQCRFCPMAFARKLPCRYHELRRHPKGAGVP